LTDPYNATPPGGGKAIQPTPTGQSSALAVPEEPAGGDLSYLLKGSGVDKPLYLGPPSDPSYTWADRHDKDDVKAIIEELRELHEQRIMEAREYSWFLDANDPGYFKEDEDLIRDDIMEVMPLMGEREAHNFRCGFLAMHDAYPRLLNRDSLDRDEAIANEDLITFLFQSEERQYSKAWSTDLRWAEPEHFQRFGMMVGLDVLNPLDYYCGMDMYLLDPLTVFPVWGGSDGIDEVYRVYSATNQQIIASYGGKPGSEEYERVAKAVYKNAEHVKLSSRKKRYSRTQRRTVIEAWNRDHFAAYLDEEDTQLLLERKHGYHRCPFTIRIGAFDAPHGVEIGPPENPRYSSWLDTNPARSAEGGDLARVMRPYGYKHMWAHHIAEAVAGRRLSFFKWAADPHKILEYDPSTEFRMAREIDLLPGETTRVPLPNKVNIFTPLVDPNVMAGLAADLQSNVATGALSMIRTGQVPPQTSGSALSKMVILGGASEAILVRGIQDFKRDRSEFRAYLLMSYGDAVGKPLGSLNVPSRQGYGKTPLHAITPDMIERGGMQYDIELHYWQPDVALSQYLMTLRAPSPITGKPLISDTTARRKLKLTPDVDREEDRIEDEALSGIPPIQMQRQLARIQRDIDTAQETNDHDTAESLMVAYTELEHLYMMAVATGQASPVGIRQTAGPAGGGGGDMGMTPQAPAGGGGPSATGNSMTDMGGTTGEEGGRPTGAGGPAKAITALSGGNTSGGGGD
jgi:hypothetical protein